LAVATSVTIAATDLRYHVALILLLLIMSFTFILFNVINVIYGDTRETYDFRKLDRFYKNV